MLNGSGQIDHRSVYKSKCHFSCENCPLKEGVHNVLLPKTEEGSRLELVNKRESFYKDRKIQDVYTQNIQNDITLPKNGGNEQKNVLEPIIWFFVIYGVY